MTLLYNEQRNRIFRSDVGKYIKSLQATLQARPFYRQARLSKNLEAKAASEFFSACIAELECIFCPHLNSYSAMRWFYYLRRLPNSVFTGELSTTLPNARTLIETYASRSTKIEAVSYGSAGFAFPVNDMVWRHIARFVAFTFIIYDFQVGYRCANKGFTYVFTQTAGISQKEPNRKISEAISIYDIRHSHQHTFLTASLERTGLGAVNPLGQASEKEASKLPALFWGLVDEEKISPEEFLSKEDYPELFKNYDNRARMLVRYAPSLMDLDYLFRIYRMPSMANHTINEVAALNLLALLLGNALLVRQPLSAIRVRELGYFIVMEETWNDAGASMYRDTCARVRSYLPQFKAPDSFEHFTQLLLEYHASPWPLAHGNPIRNTSSYVCIDMWAASMGFLTAINFPIAQGNIANDRATRFEDVAQEVIDDTAWGPDDVRKYRQKTLRINGENITDIDAMGEKNGTLMIVSCKSIPYSLEYDKGAHKAIRNAESTVVSAVNYWNAIVSRLRARPIGDNYDLSRFNEIIGIVCTPFAVYTSDSTALSYATSNLRSAASLNELINFLRESSASE